MSPAVAAAVPLGILLGLGLWSLLALIPRIGAPRLSARIAPYVVDISPAARELVARRPSEPATMLAGMFVQRLPYGRSSIAIIPRSAPPVRSAAATGRRTNTVPRDGPTSSKRTVPDARRAPKYAKTSRP